MERIYDVIIIGGGPAGYSAALYGARAGLDVLVIERAGAGGQLLLTDIIENYPGFPDGIDGLSLATGMEEGARRFGAVTEYGEVVSLDLSGEVKRVITDSGERLARAVIIATGASPRRLGACGEDELVGRGVHYCAHCDGRFYKGARVMVVGGGNSAVGDADYLSRLADSVTLVHRRDELRATRVEQERLASRENVSYLWNRRVEALKRVDGGILVSLVDVKTGESEEHIFDAVFVSVGREPSSELVRGIVELDDGGYIVADESTRTSVGGVYAIGDVRTKALRQIVTAVADGAVAIHHIVEEM